MEIGAPGDRYEQEADRVARRVVRRIHSGPPGQPGQGEPAQDQKFKEDKKRIMMMPVIPRLMDVGIGVSSDVAASFQQARQGGQPLPRPIREPMEQAMGADFSRVMVHADQRSDKLNRSIQAIAFTRGQDLFFRHGAYNPGSRASQELIAHELTHVLQQCPHSDVMARDTNSPRSGEGIEKPQTGGEGAISVTPVETPIIQRQVRWYEQGQRVTMAIGELRENPKISDLATSFRTKKKFKKFLEWFDWRYRNFTFASQQQMFDFLRSVASAKHDTASEGDDESVIVSTASESEDDSEFERSEDDTASESDDESVIVSTASESDDESVIVSTASESDDDSEFEKSEDDIASEGEDESDIVSTASESEEVGRYKATVGKKLGKIWKKLDEFGALAPVEAHSPGISTGALGVADPASAFKSFDYARSQGFTSASIQNVPQASNILGTVGSGASMGGDLLAITRSCMTLDEIRKEREKPSGKPVWHKKRLRHRLRTAVLDLVDRSTNNVVVILAFGVRQRKLLRSAAPHALANSASLVE